MRSASDPFYKMRGIDAERNMQLKPNYCRSKMFQNIKKF